MQKCGILSGLFYAVLAPPLPQQYPESGYAGVAGLRRVWSVQVPAPPLPRQYPVVSNLNLVVQEWWTLDGFGPYKYRHHHCPNNIPIYCV